MRTCDQTDHAPQNAMTTSVKDFLSSIKTFLCKILVALSSFKLKFVKIGFNFNYYHGRKILDNHSLHEYLVEILENTVDNKMRKK